MLTTQWTILAVSALTDGVITGGTAIMTAMVGAGSTAMPGKAVILLAVIGGVVAAARTVQQALKASMGAPIAQGGGK